jgi:thioredoxin 1
MAELIKHVDDTNFTNETSKGLTLVDFHAEWCGPCRMMAPIIEEFAKQMQGKVNVVKVDVDSSQKTAQDFQVTSIPTMILLKNGKETKRIVGLKDLQTLKSLISSEL